MIQLLGVVGSLAQTFLEGKVEKEKAKSEIMKTAAQHDSKWEMIMAESTKGSWKDEVITIAVLTPCILSFIIGVTFLNVSFINPSSFIGVPSLSVNMFPFLSNL